MKPQERNQSEGKWHVRRTIYSTPPPAPERENMTKGNEASTRKAGGKNRVKKVCEQTGNERRDNTGVEEMENVNTRD